MGRKKLNFDDEASTQSDEQGGVGGVVPPADPIQIILDKLDLIEKNHIEFKKQTTEVINRQTERINDLLGEFSKINPPSISDMQTNVNTATQGDYIDKEGINWGPNYKSKDEFSNNSDSKFAKQLNSWGINPNQIVSILGAVANSYLQRGPQNNLGQIFQEFMIREFFENYQSNKMLQKAQFGMLLKRGWISEDDYKQVIDNSGTLNDPLNKMIKGMKDKPA